MLHTATRASSFPARRGPLAIVAAFVRRDWSVTRSYRLPFILDGVYGILQLAVFFFVSRTFGDVGPAELNGAPSYFAFAAVGIVVGLVVEAASEGVAERVREGQLSGTLEALVAQPLSTAELCAGLAAFPFIFAVVRASVYLLIAGLWMGHELSDTSWVGLAVMFLTGVTSLACLGLLAGAVVLVYKRGEVLAGMILFGMSLISGAVFPVSALPDWLERIGSVLPLRFAFDGVRDALFLGSGWAADALVLAGFSVVGLPAAVWVFGRALETARRAGTIGQY